MSKRVQRYQEYHRVSFELFEPRGLEEGQVEASERFLDAHSCTVLVSLAPMASDVEGENFGSDLEGMSSG